MQARKGDGFALLMFVLPPCVRWTNFREIRRRFGKIFEKPSAGNFQAAKAFPDTRFRRFRRILRRRKPTISKLKQLVMK